MVLSIINTTTLPHLWQPKGADRKQKTDREKMEKRAPQEKEKYQPSYETTILTEVRVSVLSEWDGGKCWIWRGRCGSSQYEV